MKARIQIPPNCFDYPTEARKLYQNQIVEVDRIYREPIVPRIGPGGSFRPYLTLKDKSLKILFWGNWFYLDHAELLDDGPKLCNCELRLLMNRGCRCGGK